MKFQVILTTLAQVEQTQNRRASSYSNFPLEIILYHCKENYFFAPKLGDLFGKEQAQSVWNPIDDWNISDKVYVLCCDTTVSNQISGYTGNALKASAKEN